MKAPNGKPSNLTPEQYRLVRTPAFKKWFGDWEKLANVILKDPAIDDITLGYFTKDVSKVVDENGEPLVVYHGTNEDFNVFDVNKFNKNEKSGDYIGEGFYFTNEKSKAKQYGLYAKPFFLKSKSPLLINEYNYFKKIVEDMFGFNNVGSIKVLNYYQIKKQNPSKIKNKFIEFGYDGLIDNLYNQYAVFEPNQIKLADGTNTKFDSNNPDIRFGGGGTTNKNINLQKINMEKQKYCVVVVKFDNNVKKSTEPMPISMAKEYVKRFVGKPEQYEVIECTPKGEHIAKIDIEKFLKGGGVEITENKDGVFGMYPEERDKKTMGIKMGVGGTMDSSMDTNAPILMGTMGSSMRTGGSVGIKSSGYHRHNYSLVSDAFFKYNENYEKAFEIWNLEKPKIKEFIEKNGGWNIDFTSMGIKERPKNNWRQDPFINLVVSFNIDGENEIGKKNIIDYYSGIGKNKIGDMYWDYVNSKYYYYEKSMRDGGSLKEGLSKKEEKLYRSQLMAKIDFEKTKYYGRGYPTDITTEELLMLFNEHPNWNKLDKEEKEHFYKIGISKIPIDTFIRNEYGGEDDEIINRLKKEHQDAILYSQKLGSSMRDGGNVNDKYNGWSKQQHLKQMNEHDRQLKIASGVYSNEGFPKAVRQDAHGRMVFHQDQRDMHEKMARSMRDGGNVEEVDLFERYDLLPVGVQDILTKFGDMDIDYENCRALQNELEPLGYTFDWGLDAEPHNLRKIMKGENNTDADEPQAEDFKQMAFKYKAEGDKFSASYIKYLESGDVEKAEQSKILGNEAYQNEEKARQMWQKALDNKKMRKGGFMRQVERMGGKGVIYHEAIIGKGAKEKYETWKVDFSIDVIENDYEESAAIPIIESITIIESENKKRIGKDLDENNITIEQFKAVDKELNQWIKKEEAIRKDINDEMQIDNVNYGSNSAEVEKEWGGTGYKNGGNVEEVVTHENVHEYKKLAPEGYEFSKKKFTALATKRLGGYWIHTANVNEKRAEIKADRAKGLTISDFDNDWLVKYNNTKYECLTYLKNNGFLKNAPKKRDGGNIKEAEEVQTEISGLKAQKSSIMRGDGIANSVTRMIDGKVAKLEVQEKKLGFGGGLHPSLVGQYYITDASEEKYIGSYGDLGERLIWVQERERANIYKTQEEAQAIVDLASPRGYSPIYGTKIIKQITQDESYKDGGIMNSPVCVRCGCATNGVTTMSMFNEDVICMPCKEKERNHPNYKKAVNADIEAIKGGNYNFKGIAPKGKEMALGGGVDGVMQIIPETKEFDEQSKDAIRISYTYLHGDLQNDAGYDIFGIKGWALLDSLNLENNYLTRVREDVDLTGEHACEFNGKPCTFFLWTDTSRRDIDAHKYRGLVVYNDDKEYYDHAKENYIKKARNLENGGSLKKKDDDEISQYYDSEFEKGAFIPNIKQKQIITEKIGFNETTADWLIETTPKFAVWIADGILKKEMASSMGGNYEDKENNFGGGFVKVDNDKVAKKAVIDWQKNQPTWLRQRYSQYIRLILDWLMHPLTPKQNLRELSFDEAIEKAKKWHDELQTLGGDVDYKELEENTILKRYPKTPEGAEYYWVLIPKSFCDVESKRMGHCGRTGASSLISLRSIIPYGKGHTLTDSHVTIAWDEDEALFYQIKGKKIQKPSAKYHDYIFDLMKDFASDEDHKFKGFGVEYQPEQDYGFEDMSKEQILELYEINPNIFNDFEGEALLYDLGISSEKPNTIINIEKPAEYVGDLLNLDRNFDSEFIEKILTQDYGEELVNNRSYHYGHYKDLIENLDMRHEL